MLRAILIKSTSAITSLDNPCACVESPISPNNDSPNTYCPNPAPPCDC